MAYCKARLKRNGNKASPCFKPSLIGNMSDKNNHKKEEQQSQKGRTNVRLESIV
jgi:hypothetical protein